MKGAAYANYEWTGSWKDWQKACGVLAIVGLTSTTDTPVSPLAKMTETPRAPIWANKLQVLEEYISRNSEISEARLTHLYKYKK